MKQHNIIDTVTEKNRTIPAEGFTPIIFCQISQEIIFTSFDNFVRYMLSLSHKK